jgi:alanyl-tRNA synthetase
VDTVRKEPQKGTIVSGAFAEAFEPTVTTARVDAARRHNIERNHSATHLLHLALRRHLGSHAGQAGSLVGPDRLRFDFTHQRPIEPDLIRAIERDVNEQIWANYEAVTRELPYAEALQLGAMAFFSEKYGDTVRVVQMGQSLELCGGTHVRSTGQVGLFRLTAQSGVAAGVRRVEAVTGPAAYAVLQDLEARLGQVAERLKAQPEHLTRKVDQLLEERAKLEARLAEALRGSNGATAQGETLDVGGVQVTLAETSSEDRTELGNVADRFREGKRGAVLVLFGTAGRGAIHVAVTDDLVSAGHRAGDLVNRIAAVSGGKGGGRPHFASAGAGDPGRLQAARAAIPELVAGWLGNGG